MDAPQLQYATTTDGVRIACWALGTGPPVIYLPPMPGHVLREWESEVFGDVYRSIMGRYRVIRFDFRNSGLSERPPVRANDDDTVLDFDAVLERLGIDQVTIRALGPAGLAAVTYASQRPDRVSALVLSECFASFSDIAGDTQVSALMSLVAQDYETFTETMANIFFGWEANNSARQFASLLRASMTQEEFVAGASRLMESDVSDLLPQVKAKTLVLHHRGARLVPMAAAQRLADGIPNARLVILEGETVAGPRDDPAETAVIDDFILGEQAPSHSAPPAQAGGTAVILFADIADSTALTERLGDAAFREKARGLDEALRRGIASNGGTAIEGKLLGDGVLAVFGAAREAIACAQACHEGGRHAGLLLHVGIHAGDVIREEGNVYGGAVNIASRVAGEAAAGETLVSGTVRDLARTSAGVSFEDRGARELKGVSEPVRVYEVRWLEAAP